MAAIEGDALQLFDNPNHAVVSTLRPDGSMHSAVVWVDLEDGRVALNSALGRAWPTNLERDPRITVTVFASDNPYEYVEVRGTATLTLDGADAHIDRLAKKYLGVEAYPGRRPEEQRSTSTRTASATGRDEPRRARLGRPLSRSGWRATRTRGRGGP